MPVFYTGYNWLFYCKSSGSLDCLPCRMTAVRVVYITVWFSTLLTGRCGRNCLYLNWLSNQSLAKRSFRKVVLADSCRVFNLVIPSSSVSYHECVPNRACQEGRNFAPVHAIWPWRVSLCPVPVTEPCLSVSLFCRIFLLCHFRGCLRSYVLMRRLRFRSFAFQWAFRPSWQVDMAVIVCILID